MVMVVYGQRRNHNRYYMLTCIRFDFKQERILQQQYRQSLKIYGFDQQQQKMNERKQFQLKFTKIEEQIEKINKQISQNKAKDVQKQKQKQLLQAKKQQLHQQQQQNKKIHLRKQIVIIVEEIIKKAGIQEFKGHIQQIVERIQQKNINLSQQNEERYQKFHDYLKSLSQGIFLLPIRAQDWIDHECFAYKNRLLEFKQNQIIAQQYNFFFSKQKILPHCNFFVKINKIKECIGIGIVDSQSRNQSFLKNLKNLIQYRSDCRFKQLLTNHESKGSGFKQGETVEVIVNLQNGYICWKVNNQIRHEIKRQPMSKQINWVPIFILPQKGDSISIYKRS